MVSVYPIPPQEQGYFNSFKYLRGDTMKANKKFDENNSDYMVFGSGLEDPSRKVRKPYTITKSRESWSEQEHDKFLEALQLFDRDWKKIEAFIGSKTVIQIRSHAQKYFMKVQKNGTSEHVPPPRPKRKAAHPYPQKAPKIIVSGAGQPLQSSDALLDSGYVARPESLPISRNPLGNASLSTWSYNAVPAASTSDIPKDHTGFTLTHNYSSSSNESTPRVWTYNEANPQVKEKDNKPTTTRVMPDFAQVYSFIGSVFDPSESDHLLRLKKMDPIDIETILMMMKNLSVNLASPEFDAHRKLLSSPNIGLEEEKARSTISSA